MQFDKGFASQYFATNTDKMIAEIEEPYILITDKKISAIADLLPFLEKFVKVSKNLVIIADDIDGEALATLVVNKLRGTFNALVVKAPGFETDEKKCCRTLRSLREELSFQKNWGRNLTQWKLKTVEEQIK